MGTTQIRRPMAGMGVLVAIASLLTFLMLSPAHAVGAPARVQSENAQMIADLFDEHNRQRREHGLPALVFSPTISLRVTQPFTNTMAAADNGTIWHNDADDIRRGGSNWAENVIGGFRGETAADLVGRWMDSSGHRTNLLNRNYTTIAIGFAYADNSDWLFATTNFYADPKDAGPTYRTGARMARLPDGSQVERQRLPHPWHPQRQWPPVAHRVREVLADEAVPHRDLGQPDPPRRRSLRDAQRLDVQQPHLRPLASPSVGGQPARGKGKGRCQRHLDQWRKAMADGVRHRRDGA